MTASFHLQIGSLVVSVDIEATDNNGGDDILSDVSSWSMDTYCGAARIITIIARDGADVVAALRAGCDGEPLEIDKVWVRESFRRQGLALKLLHLSVINEL